MPHQRRKTFMQDLVWPESYINRIICGDCLTVMKGIPDKAVDLVLTDPPYGINYSYWDKDTINIAEECKRILKPNGSVFIFSGWSNVLEVKNQFNSIFNFRNWIIYDRIKGRGAIY